MFKSFSIFLILCLNFSYADIPDIPNCNSIPNQKINWSQCNKSYLNLDSQNLSFSDFYLTDFRHASFIGSNISGSILTGANIEGVDFSNTKLEGVMWIDGRLCTTIKSKCQNRLPLNMGYELLKEMLDLPANTEELKSYYRRQLKSSITYNIDSFTFLYKDAKNKFKDISTTDPLSFEEFKLNDQVLILKSANGIYHVFSRDYFLNWIKSPSCKFSNPLTNEPLNFVINN